MHGGAHHLAGGRAGAVPAGGHPHDPAGRAARAAGDDLPQEGLRPRAVPVRRTARALEARRRAPWELPAGRDNGRSADGCRVPAAAPKARPLLALLGGRRLGSVCRSGCRSRSVAGRVLLACLLGVSGISWVFLGAAVGCSLGCAGAAMVVGGPVVGFRLVSGRRSRGSPSPGSHGSALSLPLSCPCCDLALLGSAPMAPVPCPPDGGRRRRSGGASVSGRRRGRGGRASVGRAGCVERRRT
jgi:hypothetical protein